MQNYRDNNILISLGTKNYEGSIDVETLEEVQGCYKDPITGTLFPIVL